MIELVTIHTEDNDIQVSRLSNGKITLLIGGNGGSSRLTTTLDVETARILKDTLATAIQYAGKE